MEALEKRLETMTGNYQVLSKRMQGLSGQLETMGNAHIRLMERLEGMKGDQGRLEAQLKVLQVQLSES
jgi:septation ring formation regulator EzrA